MSSERATSQVPLAPNVLLSIKPEWADAILGGEKRYEYRKVAPTEGPPMRVVLYASAPVKAAVGVAWSYRVLRDQPVDELIEATVYHTPHTAQDVREYFGDAETGSAIRIGAYRRFDQLIPREELVSKGLTPSQNFRYIDRVPANAEMVEPARVRVKELEVSSP